MSNDPHFRDLEAQLRPYAEKWLEAKRNLVRLTSKGDAAHHATTQRDDAYLSMRSICEAYGLLLVNEVALLESLGYDLDRL